MDCISVDVISNAWRFSRGDGSIVAPLIRLLPRGIVGGYLNRSERSWRFRNGVLEFLDIDDVVTTQYCDVRYDSAGVVQMTGPYRFNSNIHHVLDRVPMPSALDFGQSSRQSQAEFVRKPSPESSSGRRNLVVIRANELSLHPSWDRNIDESDRNWDLCVSWYGHEPAKDPGTCEYLTIQPEDRKFGAIHALFQPESPLWDYDQIWLPDDDLRTNWRDINRLFSICRRHQFDLSQPCLEPESFASHKATLLDSDYSLRYTNFVEVMCPLFSRNALRLCLPTFNGSISGWGLDLIWPCLLGRVHTRMAIIDDVAVAHTRPGGQNYDVSKAAEEMEKIMALYGSGIPLTTVGGLRKDATFL